MKNLDRFKLLAAEISKNLSAYSEIKQAHAATLQTIDGDTTRTADWKRSERAKYLDLWGKVAPGFIKAANDSIEKFETEFERLNNPTMQLAPFQALGANTPVDDAAMKAEFRGLLGTISPADRREWFSKLAEEGDLGRIGVLVAMEPTLREDALALSIPGRDEALKVAAQIRATVKEHRAQEASDRFEALKATQNPTQRETIEMLALADRMNRIQQEEKALAENALTDEERAMYTQLRAKAEAGGTLSPGEGVRLIALSEKEARWIQAEANLKAIPKPAPTDANRARFQELLSKPSLSPSEQSEVVRLGGLLHQATKS